MADITTSLTDPNLFHPDRLTTGISGLDTILNGGLLNRATHLFAGASGAGKTILAQQIAFHQASLFDDQRILYYTFLSENHDKMLTNLSTLSFFDPSKVGQQIFYLSLYDQVLEQGLDNLATLIREEVMRQKVRLVIIDDITSLRDFATSPTQWRQILFNLNTRLAVLGCTLILLVDDEMVGKAAPENAVADSIFYLRNQLAGLRLIRFLEVAKARATSFISGLHHYQLSKDGIKVYPRIEALLQKLREKEQLSTNTTGKNDLNNSAERFRMGIKGLDEMLGGGLLLGTVNILFGTPGAGKTVSGLRFIYEGLAEQKQAGLVFSFQHSPQRLLNNSRSLGFDLAPFLEQGLLKIVWEPPVEKLLDEVAGELVKLVEEFQPQRLFIDAFSDLEALSLTPERMREFWTALTNYLRARKVVTVGSLEYNTIIGPSLQIPELPISTIADCLILLRETEIRGNLHQLISILEMRDSDYAKQVREYIIDSKMGLRVGEPLVGLGNMLSGKARKLSQ